MPRVGISYIMTATRKPKYPISKKRSHKGRETLTSRTMM